MTMKIRKMVIFVIWYFAIINSLNFITGFVHRLVSPWLFIDMNIENHIKFEITVISLVITGVLVYLEALPGVRYIKEKVSYENVFQIWYILIFFIVNIMDNLILSFYKVKIYNHGFILFFLAFYITRFLFSKEKLSGSKFIKCADCQTYANDNDKYCRHCGIEFE